METTDIKTILVPIDFSDTSLKALDEAVYLANITNATINLLHVAETIFPTDNAGEHYATAIHNLEEHEQEVFTRAKEYTEKLKERLNAKNDIQINPITVTGWVKDQILEVAEEINADIIIMGTHGVKGFKEMIIGSNTFRVVNECKIPVLSVQKHTESPGFRKILVPFRLKTHSREKVDPAIRAAKIYHSTIHLLAINTEEGDEEELRKVQYAAEQTKEIIEEHGIKCEMEVRSTDYLADTVSAYAQENKMDMIVIMSHLDRVTISEYFMGPFSQQIVNHSPIPVLSIHPTFNPNTVDLRGYGWSVST